MAGNRRQFLIGAGLAAAASTMGLSACGGGGGGTTPDGKTAIQFTWWGNDVRNKNTTDAIAAYSTANPNVSISPQPGEWASYWDKLATQTAGGTSPDMIQMDMAYISEYGDRGALLDLEKYGADTSKFSEGTVDSGRIGGTLYGINAGINTPTILANPAAFKAAGVDMPDDSTWTWDEAMQISAEITSKTKGKIVGIAAFVSNDALFSAWLRQQGKELFVDKGLGFEAADAQAWLELMQKYAEAKAIPGASAISEEASKPLDQGAFVLGNNAMSMYWSNQVEAVNKASGKTMEILRFPSLAGKATERKAWYKASMLWSASARTKNPEATVALINWWVNSMDCANICLAERGVPPNAEIRAAIEPKLAEAQQGVAKFISDIEPELATTPIAPPPGGGTLGAVLQRYALDMLFGRSTAADAATKFVDELKSNLQV